MFRAQLSPALGSSFFFSSAFLVSDKIFATALSKDVNDITLNNLGSWSGGYQRRKCPLFSPVVFEGSGLVDLLDHGSLFSDAPILLN